MEYRILEANMPRLEKKLQRIKNKCNKYDVYFQFNILRTEIAEIKLEDDTVENVKYVWVDVEGELKHEDWEFVASIDHTSHGNVVRAFKTDIEVPEKYYHSACECHHCNTRRIRKGTYLVHNSTTDEWKQVGRSCLQEFTSGLSAEDTTRYISLYDELIKGETPYTGVTFSNYYKLDRYLCYVKGTVDKFGYIGSGEYHEIRTRDRAFDYYLIKECGRRGKFYQSRIDELEKYDFDFFSEENVSFVSSALNWIRNIEDESGFLFNLKVCCAEDYFESKNIGFVTSLIITYMRELDMIDKKKKEADRRKKESDSSEYQGEIGERITFESNSIRCVYSFYNDYGLTFLYKIVDNNGNVYMWSTGKDIELGENETVQVTGTVKEHSEYRDVKQTKLTRCKIQSIPSQDVEPACNEKLDELIDSVFA